MKLALPFMGHISAGFAPGPATEAIVASFQVSDYTIAKTNFPHEQFAVPTFVLSVIGHWNGLLSGIKPLFPSTRLTA